MLFHSFRVLQCPGQNTGLCCLLGDLGAGTGSATTCGLAVPRLVHLWNCRALNIAHRSTILLVIPSISISPFASSSESLLLSSSLSNSRFLIARINYSKQCFLFCKNVDRIYIVKYKYGYFMYLIQHSNCSQNLCSNTSYP